MRYVLKDGNLAPLLIVESPTERDARMWGYRHLSRLPNFAGGVETEDAYLARTRGALVESFRARYVSEGASPEEAERMAEAAAGEPPALRVVRIEAQEPMLSRAGGEGTS